MRTDTSEMTLSQPVHPVPRARAWRELVGMAVVVAGLLIVFAGAYGYHRDELYFLAAGHHLAWAYPDQGVLTPLIAHLMSLLAPGSLTVLRVPSALLSAGTVLLTGLMSRELGGTRRAQVIAGACAAVSSVVLGVGHLLSTTTFDVFAWSGACWLTVRIMRSGESRLWIAVGALAGCALLNKPLIAGFLGALLVALMLVGPRAQLRSPWLLLGALIVLALWLPWLLWQSGHGWPQLRISSAIAGGGSASSQPRWAFFPFLLLLVSPVLAPVWLTGLVDLLRREALRPVRSLGVSWLLLAGAFVAAGGKPYYLAGLFPVLLAAGSLRVAEWTTRGAARTRSALLAGAIALSGVVSIVIALPLLPARDTSVIVGMDPDVGETIGWPALALGVQRAYVRAGGHAVIFTANYGEAGAIDRYGPALGLPRAYSGHNGFAAWGPPPDHARRTIAVGLSRASLGQFFSGCAEVGRVRNAAGIANEEEGAPIDLCSGLRRRWSLLWPRLTHLS